MKNKTVIFILAGLAAITTASIFTYLYLAKQKQSNVNPADNVARENAGNPSKFTTDDFSIDIPVGWKQTAPPMGASAMIVNVNENFDEPAAQKINFKSYLAVSYDTLQGTAMDAYLEAVKIGLQQTIPNTVFITDKKITISGKPANAIEMAMNQQGVNFKVLMVIVGGINEDVWVISFNTTKNNWDIYKEMFYNIADSFSLNVKK